MSKDIGSTLGLIQCFYLANKKNIHKYNMKLPKMYGLRVALLLCVSLSLSHSAAVPDKSNEEFVENDYDTYEDYDTYGNASVPEESATIAEPIPSVITMSTTIATTTYASEMLADSGTLPIGSNTTEIVIPSCPASCECYNEMTFVNCSKRLLTEIPSSLPTTVIHLDLSHNEITGIAADAFNNLTEIRQILLNHNHIATINEQVFAKLHRLDLLNLTANSISSVDKVVFAETLSILSLDDNPIVLPENNAFLSLPELQQLSMEGCNLTNVYVDTFRNLSGLTTLNLRKNAFDENLNVAAFAPLKELHTLKLSTLPQQSIHELCRLLEVIDLINTDSYDISCLELVSGMTYEESTITLAPPVAKKPLQADTTIAPVTVGQTVLKSTTPKAKQVTERPIVSENGTRPKVDAKNGTLINATSGEVAIGDGASHKEVPPNVVNISSHTLRHILIGIIIVAIAGLAIGIIFRRDVCGIKTKMCRRRRPPPTDQVRPAEQIPLTKI